MQQKTMPNQAERPETIEGREERNSGNPRGQNQANTPNARPGESSQGHQGQGQQSQGQPNRQREQRPQQQAQNPRPDNPRPDGQRGDNTNVNQRNRQPDQGDGRTGREQDRR